MRIKNISILMIITAALAVRICNMGASFWLDEVLQLMNVSQPWGVFWQAMTAGGLHPPLDYMVGRWLYHGFFPSNAEVVFRMPSLIWGTGALLLLYYWLCRRTSQGFAGLFLLLACLSPVLVRYAQEFRPYALGLFLLALSLVLFEHLAEHFSLAVLLSLYLVLLATWYTNYLAMGAQAALLAYFLMEKIGRGAPGARSLLRWSPWVALFLILGYLPWLIPVMHHASRTAHHGGLPYTWGNLLSILHFFAFGYMEYSALSAASVLFWLCVGAGFASALTRSKYRFLAVWLILTPLTVLLFQMIRPQFPVARYFIMAVPGILGCVAVLIATLWEHPRGRWPAILLTAGILYGQAWTLSGYYADGRPDWRAVAAWVRSQWNPGERVFAQNGELYFPLAYYLNGVEELQNHGGIPIYDLDENPYPLNWAWNNSRHAQLILYDNAPDSLWNWTQSYPSRRFALERARIIRLPRGMKPQTIPRP